jgi:hypothetical protein
MASRKARMSMVDIRILGNIQKSRHPGAGAPITSPSQQSLHRQDLVHNQASPILSSQPQQADRSHLSLESTHSQVNSEEDSSFSTLCGSDREVMDSKTEKECSEGDRIVVFGVRLVVAWIELGFERCS